MSNATEQRKRQAVAEYALGTVSLEGCNPSPQARQHMQKWVNGEMTLQHAIQEAKRRHVRS